jgi:hypothetical protein
MTLNEKLIEELENQRMKPFPEQLKDYLLDEYGEEPFPYGYSEQDLYTHVLKDIAAFESGNLVIVPRSPEEKWKEEKMYLQGLYIEKHNEVRKLEEYVAKLEKILSEHNLETPEMLERDNLIF